MESPPARFAASKSDAAFLSLTRAMPRRNASSYADVPARDDAASTSCEDIDAFRSSVASKLYVHCTAFSYLFLVLQKLIEALASLSQDKVDRVLHHVRRQAVSARRLRNGLTILRWIRYASCK